MKYTYPVIFNGFGFPGSYFTRALWNIYPLLQSRNIKQLQNIFEVGEILWVKVREIVNLTVQINKSGGRTYLNEDEESLVVASAKIEGGNGIPLYCCGVSQKLQNFSKDINSRCGDYDNPKNYPSGVVPAPDGTFISILTC